MATAAWIALAFCFVAVVGSTAFAATRGWRVWRSLRSFSRATGGGLDAVLRTAAAAEEHAVALSGGGERLTVANDRLQASLERLALLRAAVGEARGSLARVRGVVPRK